MDRIRAGLTGLGVVFLITAVASLLFAPSPAEQAKVEQVKEPGEPLSQLGVAPNSEKEALPPSPPLVTQPAPAEPATDSRLSESPVNGSGDPGGAGLPFGKDQPVAI